jgi:tetratricopeptide (TPR) repeat protein
MRRLLILVLIVCWASPAPAKRRKRRTKAATAFRKGLKLFKRLDYLGALEQFRNAYRYKRHYAPLCNIGRCHERLGDMVRAASFFERCLKEGASHARVKRDIEISLARVRARITQVEIKSPGSPGVLYLDGKEIGPTPIKISINPGTRSFEVRREGYQPAGAKLTTRGGEERTLTLVPTPFPKPPEPTPPAPLPAAPVVKEKPHHTISTAWFWTSAVITTGLTVASVVLGLRSLADRDDYERRPSYELYDDAKASRLVANLFIGAAVAAAAATTTLFFITDFSNDAGGGEQAKVIIGVRGSF